MSEPVKKKVCSETREILVGGKYTKNFGTAALVSFEDYEKVGAYKWMWRKDGYVFAGIKLETGRYTTVQLSRFILGASKSDKIVDHINGDKHDNRRENLRFATRVQNSQNKKKEKGKFSSDYHGVAYLKRNEQYSARVTINGERLYLGLYETPEAAVQIYDRFIVHHKEELFFKLNFPNKRDEYLILPPIKPKEKEKRKKFKNVYKLAQRYRAIFLYKNERRDLGLFDTEEDAAMAIDKYTVEHKFDRALTFPDRFPDYRPPIVFKFKCIEVNVVSTEKILGISNTDVKLDIILQFGSNVHYTIIERDDLNKLSHIALAVDQYGYIDAHLPGKKTKLHRHLMNAPDGLVVDHINGNVRDNRKRFLRIITADANTRNRKKSSKKLTSNFIGVSKGKKHRKKWSAYVNRNGLKVFKKYGIVDETVAARMRDLFVLTNYPGEYRLNFDDWDNPGIIDEWKLKIDKAALPKQ